MKFSKRRDSIESHYNRKKDVVLTQTTFNSKYVEGFLTLTCELGGVRVHTGTYQVTQVNQLV